MYSLIKDGNMVSAETLDLLHLSPESCTVELRICPWMVWWFLVGFAIGWMCFRRVYFCTKIG